MQIYFEKLEAKLRKEVDLFDVLDDLKITDDVSVLWTLEEGNSLRVGNPHEQAVFLIKWAQEEFYLFDGSLKKHLPDVKTHLKTNVIRVAQKIRD